MKLKQWHFTYQQSYDLWSPEAADRLYYYNISRNQQLSLKYLKEAAKLDHINACIALGIGGLNNRTVDPEYAKELIMKAGKAGDSEAINFLMQLYRSGHLTKQDLETTFRAKQHALEEVKSEDREFAKRFYAFCTKFGLNVWLQRTDVHEHLENFPLEDSHFILTNLLSKFPFTKYIVHVMVNIIFCDLC